MIIELAYMANVVAYQEHAANSVSMQAIVVYEHEDGTLSREATQLDVRCDGTMPIGYSVRREYDFDTSEWSVVSNHWLDIGDAYEEYQTIALASCQLLKNYIGD
jgi:hypothetical protein